MSGAGQNARLLGKKRVLPNEIAHRFNCKDDFLNYFGSQLQMYVPPKLMVNKGKWWHVRLNSVTDFLRQVLTEEKELLPLSAVKLVTVPNYDELSVKNMWPHMRKIDEFMKFFPDNIPKGRLPAREYFFNIMNTINTEYVQQLIRHATEQRHSAANTDMQQESIVVSDRMLEQLNALPYVSCKYILLSHIM